MKINTVLQIGEFHLNHCEDYLIAEEIGPDKILAAVMDGCTMASESYFAATLVGKILKKITKTKGYKELYGIETPNHDIEDYLKSILAELFTELRKTQEQLLLEQKDLLTTLILLIIDKKKNEGLVLVIGDGLVCINGTITEFDQDNKPDYLGFHLNEDFESWFHSLSQKIYFKGIRDVSIATDGISMFKRYRDNNSDPMIDPIDFIVNDITEPDLTLKLKKLEHVYGMRPTDDLAVIRLIN